MHNIYKVINQNFILILANYFLSIKNQYVVNNEEYSYRLVDQSGRRFYVFLLEIINLNEKAGLDKIKRKLY